MNDAELVNRIAFHEQRLLERYRSPLVGATALRTLLGFGSGQAFRVAARRERLPVPTFFQEGRRGRFARVSDLAAWLAAVDAAILNKKERI